MGDNIVRMRTHGIPRESSEAEYLFRSDQPLKNHPLYKDAKSGDLEAAVALVSDLAGPLVEKTLRFGHEVIYVAPHAIEASGENAIPQTLAVGLAKAHGARHDTDIVQRNKVFHTGADAMQRLIAPSEFFGKVEPGGRYVLVDDVTTLGGTLADLAGYIQENGGHVAGMVVLANASRSGKIIPAAHLVRQIKQRYGDEIAQLFNINPDALTAEEAGYLIGFRDADELRNRAVAAKQARVERLRSKGIRLETDQGDVIRSE
jgi:hypothetical protein